MICEYIKNVGVAWTNVILPIVLSIIAAIIFAIVSKLFSFGTRKRIRLIVDDMIGIEAQLVNNNNVKDYSAFMSCINQLKNDVLKIYSEIRLCTYFFSYRKKKLIYLYLCNLLIYTKVSRHTWADSNYMTLIYTQLGRYLGLQYTHDQSERVPWLRINICILKYLNERVLVNKCFDRLISDAAAIDTTIEMWKKAVGGVDINDKTKIIYDVLKRMVSPFACEVSSYSKKTMSKKEYDSFINKCGNINSRNPQHDFLRVEEQWYEDIFNEQELNMIHQAIVKYRTMEWNKYSEDMKNGGLRVEVCYYGTSWVRMVYFKGIIKSCEILDDVTEKYRNPNTIHRNIKCMIYGFIMQHLCGLINKYQLVIDITSVINQYIRTQDKTILANIASNIDMGLYAILNDMIDRVLNKDLMVDSMIEDTINKILKLLN